MLAADRHRSILQLLGERGSSSTSTLAERLDVSEATIRRDLQRMHRNGLLHRVHGGALLVTEDETPFEQVVADADEASERERIAREAASMVRDGANVILDIGATTLSVARHLHNRPVTVLTSSLAVINELAGDEVVSLIVFGGTYRHNYRSFVGFLAEESIKQFRADIAFLSTSGILPDGTVSDTTMVEVPLKRAMIQSAQRTVLLATSSKFPGSGLSRVCHISAIDVLISTAEAEAPARHVTADGSADLVLVDRPVPAAEAS